MDIWRLPLAVDVPDVNSGGVDPGWVIGILVVTVLGLSGVIAFLYKGSEKRAKAAEEREDALQGKYEALLREVLNMGSDTKEALSKIADNCQHCPGREQG